MSPQDQVHYAKITFVIVIGLAVLLFAFTAMTGEVNFDLQP